MPSKALEALQATPTAAIKRLATVLSITIGLSLHAAPQEFRSATAVQSNGQSWTIDLTGVPDASNAAIQIQNSSPTPVALPQVFAPSSEPPFTAEAVLADLGIPGSTDQARVIQAWQFVTAHTYHYCYAGNTSGVTYDPVLILSAFGFGCCEQLSYSLAWIWQQQGYQTRLAYLSGFHTVPEVFYGGSWHMLDPDHRVYYLNPDQTIASVEDILNDPAIVLTGNDNNGTDPVGWSGGLMEQLYVDSGPSLRYWPPIQPSAGSTFILRYGETMTVNSQANEDKVIFYSLSGPQAPPSPGVTSIQFDWSLSFAYPGWRQLAYASFDVDVTSSPNGALCLANTSNVAGYIIYRESSLFPVLSLRLYAQLDPGSQGALQAYYSPDGVNWSNGVSFQANSGSFNVRADLTSLGSGASSYFVKIELDGAVELHRLRISPVVQASYILSPVLEGGTQNQLTYQDSASPNQPRSITATAIIPTGEPLIPGTTAVSLIPEDSGYSLAADYAAGNLVDGDVSTLAYPGSSQMDYVVQLNHTYNVTGVSIDWGYFGTDSSYVQNWMLLGRTGNGDWNTLVTGGFPGQSTMDVALNVTATELRLIASGTNWIGAYEVRIFGKAAPPPLSVASSHSNVPEDPVFTIAANYGAAHLIDGDPSTLAYPASRNPDYELSLGTLTHLSTATIDWGYFGTSPGYVDSWRILGRTGASNPWTTLAEGGFPNSSTTSVTLDSFATDIRLAATSNTNWIGAYELILRGGQSVAPLTATSTFGDLVSCGTYQPSTHLVDGDESTFAYPCNTQFDYTVDPGDSTYIDTVKVVWGYFGSNSEYIQSWRLLGLTPDTEIWQEISRGDQPGATETLIPVQKRYRKLRVSASSSNWIGLYELEVFGNTPVD